MRISDWSSDVCASDLRCGLLLGRRDVTGRFAIASGECIAAPPALLLPPGKLVDPGSSEGAALARSWDDRPHDTWMADGGTYRRRRYGAFEVAGGKCTRLPHRPHYQERDHNPLNGGVERWFAPMAGDQTGSPLFQALVLGAAALIADASAQGPNSWPVEAHQFRIEALPGKPGPLRRAACGGRGGQSV